MPRVGGGRAAPLDDRPLAEPAGRAAVHLPQGRRRRPRRRALPCGAPARGRSRSGSSSARRTARSTISRSAVDAAGAEARALGLPLIVHATGLAKAKAALQAGAKLLVHSVWRPAVDAGVPRPRQGERDHLLSDPHRRRAATCGCSRPLGKREAPAIDDPNGCVDPATRARVAATAEAASGAASPPPTPSAWRRARPHRGPRDDHGGEPDRVRDAGIPIAMGTDAGNPLTLHGVSVYAEMEAMQKDGMTPMEVLVAATRGGASAMGREKDFGTVEKGKMADLLIVAADPTADIANLRKVAYVVRGGVLRPSRSWRPRSRPRSRDSSDSGRGRHRAPSRLPSPRASRPS